LGEKVLVVGIAIMKRRPEPAVTAV